MWLFFWKYMIFGYIHSLAFRYAPAPPSSHWSPLLCSHFHFCFHSTSGLWFYLSIMSRPCKWENSTAACLSLTCLLNVITAYCINFPVTDIILIFHYVKKFQGVYNIHFLLICCFVIQCLAWFHNLALVNSVAVNTAVQVALCWLRFLWVNTSSCMLGII